MSEKLIPCPICGSENTVRLPYNDRTDIERCKNCNLTIIVPIGYTMWNTRPIEDALNARIAELEAFIGKLIEAGGTMAKGYRCHLYLDERQPINDWMKLEKDWKEREK